MIRPMSTWLLTRCCGWRPESDHRRPDMERGFSEAPATYTSASQIARVDTELWAATWMFCPNCGNPKLSRYGANRPVADFYCRDCGDQFELKSQARRFGRKLANGAYSTKMERLASDSSPNLLLLQYDRAARVVENLSVVPRCFFTPSVIECRKPLAATARRAGWVGSNILLEGIPASGRIDIIKDGGIRGDLILEEWGRIRFLKERRGEARGWLVDVMSCIDRLGKRRFTLSEVYGAEDHLARIYPGNRNVRPKIRQQLQVLRDNGYLTFLGNGSYELR